MNEQSIALKLDDVEFRRRRRVILTKVNLEVKKGEKWVLFGPNGIGKSTLVQMMSTRGFPSEGTVDILGNRLGKVNVFSYRNRIGLSSAELGRAFPPQEDPLDAIVTALTATTGRWRDTYTDEDYAKARSLMREFGIEYLEGKMMFKLSEGERTRVLICRALMADPDLLILDEPTAPLSNTETEELFRIVKHLHETENIAILFISHRLNEILEVCENYTVMRNGKMIDTTPVTGETTTKEIVEKMLGRKFEENFPKEACQIGDVLFQTEHLSGAGGKVKDVSIQVKKGEVVGIAGLVGAGKSELCKTIFGAYKKTGGKVLLKNRELKIANPSGAVKNRMALVPEERRKEGVLVNENVSFNLSAACLSRFCTGPFIRRRKVDDNAKRFVKDLGISTPSVRQQVKNLSGGNQQKVAVGKWLAMYTYLTNPQRAWMWVQSRTFSI